MKVLVTGASGFIGSHVARLLAESGFSVRVIIRKGSSLNFIEDIKPEVVWGDIRHPASVREAVRGCAAVFHVAALYSFWNPNPSLIYETNVKGTRNVLEACLMEGVERVIYTSTVSTLGWPKNGTLATEEMEPQPGELVGHYKRSKYIAEKEAMKMVVWGLPLVVVNPTAPVGSGDVKPTPTGRIVLDFLKGKVPGYISGAGLNLIDVEDVAAGHLLAFYKGRIGERYILGHRNLSLREVFQILAEISGRKAPRWNLPSWLALGAAYADQLLEGTILRRQPFIPLEGIRIARKAMYVDPGKAVRELGLPQTPVEQALEKAVCWFREHGYV